MAGWARTTAPATIPIIVRRGSLAERDLSSFLSRMVTVLRMAFSIFIPSLVLLGTT